MLYPPTGTAIYLIFLIRVPSCGTEYRTALFVCQVNWKVVSVTSDMSGFIQVPKEVTDTRWMDYVPQKRTCHGLLTVAGKPLTHTAALEIDNNWESKFLSLLDT